MTGGLGDDTDSVDGTLDKIDDASGGKDVLLGDTNGDGTADFTVTVHGSHGFVLEDFLGVSAPVVP